MEDYLTNKKHKFFRVKDTLKGKRISGQKLTRKARKEEKEKKGAGKKLLKKVVPDLEPIHIKDILKGTHCLIGTNVFFLAIDSKYYESAGTEEKQRLVKEARKR